jgi:hypothetical protein
MGIPAPPTASASSGMDQVLSCTGISHRQTACNDLRIYSQNEEKAWRPTKAGGTQAAHCAASVTDATPSLGKTAIKEFT